MEEKKKNEIKRKAMFGFALFGSFMVGLLMPTTCHYQDLDKDVTSSIINPLVMEPKKAYIPNSSVDVANYTNYPITYEYYNEYNGVLQKGQNTTLSYSSIDSRSIYFYTDDHFYSISDDLNYTFYGDELYLSGEAFNGSFIDFYGELNRSSVYLNLYNADVTNIYTTLLNGESLSTSIPRRVINYIDIVQGNGYFTLDFAKGYENRYNYWNNIRVNSSIELDGYSYKYKSEIYAYNTDTFAYCLIATNRYSITNNVLQFQGNNTYVTYQNELLSDVYYVPEYLNSLKFTISSNYFSLNDDYGFRAWLSNAPTTFTKLLNPENDEASAVKLWSNFGDLVSMVVRSLMPMMMITILPGVTIGALILVPLIVAFIVLLLHIVRKS